MPKREPVKRVKNNVAKGWDISFSFSDGGKAGPIRQLNFFDMFDALAEKQNIASARQDEVGAKFSFPDAWEDKLSSLKKASKEGEKQEEEVFFELTDAILDQIDPDEIIYATRATTPLKREEKTADCPLNGCEPVLKPRALALNKVLQQSQVSAEEFFCFNPVQTQGGTSNGATPSVIKRVLNPQKTAVKTGTTTQPLALKNQTSTGQNQPAEPSVFKKEVKPAHESTSLFKNSQNLSDFSNTRGRSALVWSKENLIPRKTRVCNGVEVVSTKTKTGLNILTVESPDGITMAVPGEFS